MKSSGIGRDGGDHSFDFCMETKHVSPARGTHKIQRLGIYRNRINNDGALPLPLWERVGVRGFGPSIGRNPSPGSHLRCDPTSPTRGEVKEEPN
jgi:hypothetical protein